MRATWAVPPPLWNVLLLRDRHCRWRGCDRPGHWGEAHHVVPWECGGTTDQGNLVLLCSRHHHIAHRAGWHTELDADGTFHVTDPWGVTRTTRPPATGPPLDVAADGALLWLQERAAGGGRDQVLAGGIADAWADVHRTSTSSIR